MRDPSIEAHLNVIEQRARGVGPHIVDEMHGPAALAVEQQDKGGHQDHGREEGDRDGECRQVEGYRSHRGENLPQWNGSCKGNGQD